MDFVVKLWRIAFGGELGVQKFIYAPPNIFLPWSKFRRCSMFVRSLCVGGEGEWSPFAYKFTDESSTSKGIGALQRFPPPTIKGGDRDKEREFQSGGEGFALGIEDPSQFKSQQRCVVFEKKKLTNCKKKQKSQFSS